MTSFFTLIAIVITGAFTVIESVALKFVLSQGKSKRTQALYFTLSSDASRSGRVSFD